MNYKENVRRFRDHGLMSEDFTRHLVNLASIPDSILEEARVKKDENSNSAWLLYEDMDRITDVMYKKDASFTSFSFYDLIDRSVPGKLDESYQNDFLSRLVQPADSYLVYTVATEIDNKGDDVDQYKIVSSLPEAFEFNEYDAYSIDLDEASESSVEGKVLLCTLCNQEHGMGTTMCVIALTPAESAKLHNDRAVREYVGRITKLPILSSTAWKYKDWNPTNEKADS